MKLVDCVEQYNKGEIGAETTFKMQEQILIDKVDDPVFLEFAIKNFCEMIGYIRMVNLNIRIHRGIAGEMCFFERISCKNLSVGIIWRLSNETILVNDYLVISNCFLFPFTPCSSSCNAY